MSSLLRLGVVDPARMPLPTRPGRSHLPGTVVLGTPWRVVPGVVPRLGLGFERRRRDPFWDPIEPGVEEALPALVVDHEGLATRLMEAHGAATACLAGSDPHPRPQITI